MPYAYDNYLSKAVAGEIFTDPPTTRVVLELGPRVSYRTYSSADKKSIFISFENTVEELALKARGMNCLQGLRRQMLRQATISFVKSGPTGLGHQ